MTPLTAAPVTPADIGDVQSLRYQVAALLARIDTAIARIACPR